MSNSNQVKETSYRIIKGHFITRKKQTLIYCPINKRRIEVDGQEGCHTCSFFKGEHETHIFCGYPKSQRS